MFFTDCSFGLVKYINKTFHQPNTDSSELKYITNKFQKRQNLVGRHIFSHDDRIRVVVSSQNMWLASKQNKRRLCIEVFDQPWDCGIEVKKS